MPGVVIDLGHSHKSLFTGANRAASLTSEARNPKAGAWGGGVCYGFRPRSLAVTAANGAGCASCISDLEIGMGRAQHTLAF